jgi:molybdopterin converting factor small subunit
MTIHVRFYSYFKDLAGCPAAQEDLAPETTLGDLLQRLLTRFPKLAPMRRSMLTAVGLEYQAPEYRLQDGDEVSLFPPVQGG